MNTKTHILQTALKLFVENGPGKTSMNQIANSVGISKPAIYYHFKSKAELEEGVVNYFDEKMVTWSRKNIKTKDTYKDILRNFFISIKIYTDVLPVILDEQPQNQNHSFNEIILQISKYNKKVKNKFEKIFIKTRKSLSETIKKAQQQNVIKKELNPDTLALHIHSIIEGIGFISYLDESIVLDEVGEELFNHFWNLIKE